MPRPLSSDALTKIANQVGNEPIIIMSIDWAGYIDPTGVIHPHGTPVNYADKDILDSSGNIIIPGKIIQISDLDEIIKLDINSTNATISAKLLDVDGSIKALYDIHDLHKRPVIIYQYFDGLDLSDKFEIFRGEIASPVTWSEGERTLSFDIVSKVYTLEAGFAPEQGQFAYVPIDLIGKPWPMIFGNPIHVPAAKFHKVATGTILTIFGIPDATLPYKQFLMTYIQTDLINSFNYYLNLIDVALAIEIPAYQMQEQYAHHIVGHDALKQTVEDLYDDIEVINQKTIRLTAQYNDDGNAATKASILSQLNTLKNQRQILNKAYQSYVIQSANMGFEATGYHLRLKNAKYETTIVNKIRKKCKAILSDYFNCTRQLAEISTAINNQSTLSQTSTAVMVGPDFPQDSTELFNINGLTLAGVMNDYTLSGLVAQPAYTNISIGPRGGNNPDPTAADDVTAFWIDTTQRYNSVPPQAINPNIPTPIPNLVGMYLWLGGQTPDPSITPPPVDPIDGRIVQVTQQSVNKVQCQLISKKLNPRISKEQVNYSTSSSVQKDFSETLNRLLTGNESPAQIAAIANTIPKSISPYIWNILNGGNNVIYLELQNATSYDPSVQIAPPRPQIDYTNSFFTLIFNSEEETEPIKFTDTASTIETKILDATLDIDDNDITVTIDQYWSESSGIWKLVKIKYNGLMRPFTIGQDVIINIANINPGSLTIRKMCSEPNGCFLRYNRNCLTSGFKLTPLGNSIDPSTANITLYFRGFSVIVTTSVTTPTDLLTAIQNSVYDHSLDGALTIVSINADGGTVADASLENADMKISFNQEFSPIFMDTSGISFVYSPIINPDDVRPVKPTSSVLKSKFNYPNFHIENFGGGAHEYTANQRQTKLQNLVNKNANAPAIKKYRNIIRDLNAQLAAAPSAAAAQGIRESLHNAMTTYRSMVKSVEQSAFNDDNVYKLVSNSEYELLYDMEITGYTDWVSNLTNIDAEFTDDVSYEFTMADVTYIREAATTILPRWLNRLQLDPTLNDQQRYQNGQLTSDQVLYETYLLPNDTQAWLGNVGDTISLAGQFQEQYVCSIIPGIIQAVYASKNVAGINRLIPVPSSYYIKADMNSPTIGTNATRGTDGNQYINCEQNVQTLTYADFGFYHGVTVTLTQPLNSIDPSWSDQLYVTLNSIVGPNVCDVIAWLVNTYTDLTIDLTSFQHVHNLQELYPVNFAILQKQNIINLIQDLAWQSRCTLWIKYDTVYIRYLPEEPTPYKTITKNDIKQGTLELSYTPTEDLITKLEVNWRSTYAQAQDYIMTLRRNLTRYNEVSDSRDVYCYNIRDLVWKTATWWLIRRASTWRTLKCKLFMNNIDLETQDVIAIDLNTYTGSTVRIVNNITTVGDITTADNTITVGPIKAIITKATYNSADFSIDIEAWLPVLAGQQTEYQFAFPRGLNIQNFWPLISDVAGGDAGSPLNMTVPNGLQFNFASAQSTLSLPIDMGRPNVGDNFDTEQPNPAQPFKELDYQPIAPVKINIDPTLTSDLTNDNVEHTVTDSGETKEINDAKILRQQIDQGVDFGTTSNTPNLERGSIGIVQKPVKNVLQSNENNGTRITVPNTDPSLYVIVIGLTAFVAAGKDFDVTNYTVPVATKVSVTEENGKLVFRLLTPVQPEITTDPSGQPLDDGGVAPAISDGTGGGFY